MGCSCLKKKQKQKGVGMLFVLLVLTTMCVRSVRGLRKRKGKKRRREERRGEETSIFWTVLWSLRFSASSVLCNFGWPHQENGVHCSDQQPSYLQKISESGKQLLTDDAWDNGFTSYRKSILLPCEYIPFFSWGLQSALIQWPVWGAFLPLAWWSLQKTPEPPVGLNRDKGWLTQKLVTPVKP